jgi:hypothetical protein
MTYTLPLSKLEAIRPFLYLGIKEQKEDFPLSFEL